ncbi:hypothetical protein [Plantactinospora endophytica]|uniref:Uncharacterized protein n=1 Tax=Plantactinospora endophytica TaxID=673535 RepID=A0ABQ4DVE7_9ACTN|nr:hypothetical protein [Plantactinospora endophytica]GIG86410.1 hypothetical protein Pen02_13460 [Plantactinospora endophytica]
MTTKPELAAYIRTLVRGDNEANERIETQLDAEGWDGFPRFLAALFFLAVDRRFGENATSAEVIRFVADLRAGLADDAPAIDAQDAEALIRANIDPDADYDIEPSSIGKIQAAVTYKVLTDEKITDDELDALLAEATAIASRS